MVEVELLNWSGKESVKIVADGCRITADGLNNIPDEDIISMLVENDYSSALEHIWFTFRIKCSIVCQRELLEHRIASHTTRSTRYCEENPTKSFYIPVELEEDADTAVRMYLDVCNKLYKALEEEYGREYARYILPIGLQTEFIWTINARSLINFLGLRLCVRAAPEIRELAEKVRRIVRQLVPEIFNKIGCRGVNLGVCPENEARPKNCPYRDIISTKNVVKQ